MQIKEIVLYGNNGEIRVLPFKMGRVNIISGISKSGKSVIGQIIDYCLGGTSCSIADGIVRETVSWYGLLLQFDDERVFVARQSPPIGTHSTNQCYFEIGKQLTTPKEQNFTSNSNVDGIEEMLSLRLGISENLNIPKIGQTRRPLSADIRHSLYYCFQNQDEIAAQSFLFHNQSDDFITQTIKDTMPYFLGVIDEDALRLENERIILKRKILSEKRRIKEIDLLRGGGMQKAISLISEAKIVGLLSDDKLINYNDFNELCNTLKTINNWSPENSSTMGMDKLSLLQTELFNKQSEIDSVSEQLRNVKIFTTESKGYADESSLQKARLESIGLFEKLNFEPDYCLLCSNALTEPLPKIEKMKLAIKELDANIETVTREKPKLRKHIDTLELKHESLKLEEKNLKISIDSIYKQNEDALLLRDLNVRKAKVIGKISLWLESVDIKDQNYNMDESLEMQLEEIEKLLDRDMIESKKLSILNILSVKMSMWAKELNLEYSDSPYRLDMGKVTVVVDKNERPVPLQQLGSGSNWLGIHLITYFALQSYFIDQNRPVPNFLFIDQPSQVYFPSVFDVSNTDTAEVSKIYDFIFERTKELKDKLQVIVVDHADLTDENFQNSIIEKWFDGKKLIPENWYNKN